MKRLLKGRSRPLGANWKLLVPTIGLIAITTNVLAVATFVSGSVPDWNQPYSYLAGSPNGGPGPDPALGVANQWNAWCAPSSGANLAGHWTDARSVPVADTVAFAGSTVMWAAGASWQDYLADGFARPAAQVVAGPFPASATDIGWYMDTNRGIPAGWGGYFLVNGVHRGTYLKDIHIGLQNFLNSRYSLSGSTFWRTGTRGSAFSAGTNPAGLPAAIHPSGASAFGEIITEISTNRTLILSFRHWSLNPPVGALAAVATNTEAQFGGTYYTWGPTPSPGASNAEDEDWNMVDTALGLGHAVTCVGYIPAGDTNDMWAAAGLAGPTDWVIVHDNWLATARNVIVPLNFAGAWVANTTAVPWPTMARFVKGLVPDWNQPYRYVAGSPNGGPGPDPNALIVNQWNDWCAPTSAGNLAGHWTDYHRAPVADTVTFPGSTVAWPAGPSWQDYLADGFARPLPQGAPGPLPVPTTDIGWYMDSNRGVPYDPPAVGGPMGGFFFGNPGHFGTYLKDIHVGLQNFLNSRYSFPYGGWNTGTEGKLFAAGLNPTGGMAAVHLAAPPAFNEVMFEINRDHTLILSYLHWNIGAAAVPNLPPQGTNTEAALGGAYYLFGPTPASGIETNENEEWNIYAGALGLGHAVTAVGYIPAGDVLDPGPMLPMGVPTDWVIVHDNWASTPRNVVIPFDFAMNWVANTIAYPDPGFLKVTAIGLVGGTNAVVSFTGIPGALHDLQLTSAMLTNTTWSTSVSNVAFAAGTMQVSNATSASVTNRFYRIKANY